MITVSRKQFKSLEKETKVRIIDFIKNNYEESEYLKPSLADLDISGIEVFMALELADMAEAGYAGYDLVGVSFCKKITDNLIKTRTTVIRSDRRGQGIGSKINDCLEKYAVHCGVNKIYCNIYTNNLPSIMLKLKRGYIIEGVMRDHDELKKDEYIVSKFL